MLVAVLGVVTRDGRAANGDDRAAHDDGRAVACGRSATDGGGRDAVADVRAACWSSFAPSVRGAFFFLKRQPTTLLLILPSSPSPPFSLRTTSPHATPLRFT